MNAELNTKDKPKSILDRDIDFYQEMVTQHANLIRSCHVQDEKTHKARKIVANAVVSALCAYRAVLDLTGENPAS
jgi:hypothetical protein